MCLTMTTNSEELYLEAEADIKNNNYSEAFKKYESILYEEPDSAPAHNSMGWLYKTQFDDYAKAENHFQTAVKCDPLYPHSYFHIAALLMDHRGDADEPDVPEEPKVNGEAYASPIVGRATVAGMEDED